MGVIDVNYSDINVEVLKVEWKVSTQTSILGQCHKKNLVNKL